MSPARVVVRADLVMDALAVLRCVLDAHGAACVCGDCTALTLGEDALDELEDAALWAARDHVDDEEDTSDAD